MVPVWYVTDKIISSALGITTHIPGDYLGSLRSLDSGAKVDLRKVRIGLLGLGLG